MVSIAPNPITPTIEDQILEAILAGRLPSSPAPAGEVPQAQQAARGARPLTSPPPHLLTSPLSPLALAHHFHLSLPRLLDFLALPLTQSRLAAADALEHRLEARAAKERTAHTRAKALALLESLLDSPDSTPIEKRRAATAILRGSSLHPVPPTAASSGRCASVRSARSSDSPPTSDLPPPTSPENHFASTSEPAFPPPDSPKPFADAETNLIKVLSRLADNDNPKPDSGFKTLLNFIADRPAGGKVGRFFPLDWIADPGEDGQLANFHSAIVRPPEPTDDPDTMMFWVTLHWPDGDRHDAVFRFRFKPQEFDTWGPRPEPANLWLIEDIIHHRGEPSPETYHHVRNPFFPHRAPATLAARATTPLPRPDSS